MRRSFCRQQALLMPCTHMYIIRWYEWWTVFCLTIALLRCVCVCAKNGKILWVIIIKIPVKKSRVALLYLLSFVFVLVCKKSRVCGCTVGWKISVCVHENGMGSERKKIHTANNITVKCNGLYIQRAHTQSVEPANNLFKTNKIRWTRAFCWLFHNFSLPFGVSPLHPVQLLLLAFHQASGGQTYFFLLLSVSYD